MKLRPFYHVAQFHQPSPAVLARRAAIAAEMARVAKASEAQLPPDERRQVIDVRAVLAEGWDAAKQMAIACAIATPIAFALVVWMATP